MNLMKANVQAGRSRRWHRFALALVPVCVGLLAEPSWAQKHVPPPEDSDALLRYGIALGVVVICGLTAFLNPKRTHK